jgi:hypothetical protein
VKYILFIASAISLSACVSIPDTEEELRANPHKIDIECSPLSFDETYILLAQNTTRCHANNDQAIVPAAGIFIPLSTQDVVKGQIIEDDKYAKITVEYLNPVEGGFLQVIDIKATQQCPAQVSVYVLNDTKKWQTSSQSVFKWLGGDTTSCFEMY